MGIVFAATHPDRTSKLILWNTFARLGWAPDISEESRQKFVAARLSQYEENWGTGALIERFVPSEAGDPRFREWWGRFERFSMSPGACVEAMRVNFEIDVRDILPFVRVPTLVIRHEGDHVPPGAARYLADQIPNAHLVELPGIDHFPWREEDGATEEIEEFLTGERHPPETERILATILLTDIVHSTDRVAELGDQRWHELLDRHDALINRALDRFRSHLVNTTGDGIQAATSHHTTSNSAGTAQKTRCSAIVSGGTSLRAISAKKNEPPHAVASPSNIKPDVRSIRGIRF